MDITFIGDICLGRDVRTRFDANPYRLVAQDLVDKLVPGKEGGRVIANLESPVADDISFSTAQLEGFVRFSGTSAMLAQFNWVDCFCLANNHINDFGEEGMASTIGSIRSIGSESNGLFEEEYRPYVLNEDENKIAVFTCADKVNHKIDPSSRFKLLHVDGADLLSGVKQFKQSGFFVIVYAHMGSMFCRIPNPQVLEIIHDLIDNGCDCLVVSHPHCIGGVYMYKDVPVFYSLGDFLMDGESFLRRQSCAVKLHIQNNTIKNWELVPTVTDNSLRVYLPANRRKRKIQKHIERVSAAVSKHKTDYRRFYKYQYKKDMLRHSIGTLGFVFRTKGLLDGFHFLISRKKDIHSMITRVKVDRTNRRNG